MPHIQGLKVLGHRLPFIFNLVTVWEQLLQKVSHENDSGDNHRTHQKHRVLGHIHAGRTGFYYRDGYGLALLIAGKGQNSHYLQMI